MNFQEEAVRIFRGLSKNYRNNYGSESVIVDIKESERGPMRVDKVIDFQYGDLRGVIDPVNKIFLAQQDNDKWEDVETILSDMGYRQGSPMKLYGNYGVRREEIEENGFF
jgi:hypothetical protein